MKQFSIFFTWGFAVWAQQIIMWMTVIAVAGYLFKNFKSKHGPINIAVYLKTQGRKNPIEKNLPLYILLYVYVAPVASWNIQRQGSKQYFYLLGWMGPLDIWTVYP